VELLCPRSHGILPSALISGSAAVINAPCVALLSIQTYSAYALTLIVLASSVLSLYQTVSWLYTRAEPVISLLRSLGFTRRRVLSAVCLKVTFPVLLASLAGFFIGCAVAYLAPIYSLWRILFNIILP